MQGEPAVVSWTKGKNKHVFWSLYYLIVLLMVHMVVAPKWTCEETFSRVHLTTIMKYDHNYPWSGYTPNIFCTQLPYTQQICLIVRRAYIIIDIYWIVFLFILIGTTLHLYVAVHSLFRKWIKLRAAYKSNLAKNVLIEGFLTFVTLKYFWQVNPTS